MLSNNIGFNQFNEFNNCYDPNSPEYKRCFKIQNKNASPDLCFVLPDAFEVTPSSINNTTIVISTKTRGDYIWH